MKPFAATDCVLWTFNNFRVSQFEMLYVQHSWGRASIASAWKRPNALEEAYVADKNLLIATDSNWEQH